MEPVVKTLNIEGFRRVGTEPLTRVVYVWTITLLETPTTPMVNLDDAYASLTIKRSYADATPLLLASTDDGITIDPLTGELDIQLTLAHFEDFDTFLEEQDFLYDLDLTDSTGRKYRLYKGPVVFGGDL